MSQDKERIVRALSAGPLSTRGIANSLYAVKTEVGVILPGNEKVSQVYTALLALRKEGKVMLLSKGYWSTLQQPQSCRTA